jgi:DegV family protein with EDD domain
MKVKIVTDSCSDITQEEASKLGIIVVPAYVRFGNESFRDGVDLDVHEFYRKLSESPIHPTTAAPSPGDFAEAYERATRETDKIVSIHVTRKHSAIYEAAMLAKDAVPDKQCKIEVIDSEGMTMWQALVAMGAARAADSGASLEQVVAEAYQTIKKLRALALLDTLKYIVKGGRLSNAVLTVESILNVKAFITLRNGEIRPAGLIRSRAKGIERLLEFATLSTRVEELAIAHSASESEILRITDRLSSSLQGIKPRIAIMGPALGVHAGPGIIAIIVKEKTAISESQFQL